LLCSCSRLVARSPNARAWRPPLEPRLSRLQCDDASRARGVGCHASHSERRGEGNASSIHHFGIEARLELERARRSIERLLEAPRDSLVFTSGGSESNAFALFGVLDALPHKGAPHHVITSPLEHKAVLDALRVRRDIEVTFVAPDSFGRIMPDALRAVLRPNTSLVSVMLANNELGAISPIRELVSATRAISPRAHFHCDAVQGAGRVRVSCEDIAADTYAFAAHKFHGPKGTGALVVRPGTVLARQIPGGGQERGLRAGTENVAGAVGMAAALTLATARLGAEGVRLVAMRETLWSALSGVCRNRTQQRGRGLPSRHTARQSSRRRWAHARSRTRRSRIRRLRRFRMYIRRRSVEPRACRAVSRR
jgi:cysteine sulfinate desulfinase/cysteine desulfurase-like protein